MTLMWLASRHVDQQKRELLEHLLHRNACDADHAIHLTSLDVKPSILRSMVSRKIVTKTESGRYFVDASRMHEAYGASNSFILYAMGAFLLVFLVIMLW